MGSTCVVSAIIGATILLRARIRINVARGPNDGDVDADGLSDSDGLTDADGL